jgi:hypothetical protein
MPSTKYGKRIDGLSPLRDVYQSVTDSVLTLCTDGKPFIRSQNAAAL